MSTHSKYATTIRAALICISLLATAALFTVAHADAPLGRAAGEARPADEGERSILLGLVQPALLRGINVAFTYFKGPWVFEYSHGMFLDLNAAPAVAMTRAERDADLDIYTFVTTGFGFGYRAPFMPEGHHLDLRMEFKLHTFRVRHPAGEEINYKAFSAGPGLYYRYYIGSTGIFLEPSFRLWPNFATTLDNDEHVFMDESGEEVVHEAHAFTVFGNVSLGYRF